VEIDLAKAKAEGKVLLYTSLDTKIVDSVIGPFKGKHGIDVQYYRGGSNDVTSKVLAEADAGRVQVDMVDASDLAAILLMKERGLLKTWTGPSLLDVVAKSHFVATIVIELQELQAEYLCGKIGLWSADFISYPEFHLAAVW
jgi:hypothetical protein